MVNRSAFASALALLLASHTSLAQTSRNPAMRVASFRVGADRFSAWVYVPADSARRPSAGWPLLVAMHGLGELGANLDQLRNASGSIPNVIDNGFAPDFVVVMPQVNWNRDDAFAASLMGAAITLGQSSAPTDRCRVHVTGLSMGVGYALAFMLARGSEAASWSLMSNRCWGTTPTDAQWSAMAAVPSWHSQTIGDATGCMLGMVDTLRRVRPSTTLSAWLYCSSAPNVRSDPSAACSGQTWGHSEGWSIPYAPDSRGLHSPSWWRWLASQRLASCGPASDAGLADASANDSGAALDSGALVDSGVALDSSAVEGRDAFSEPDAPRFADEPDAMDAMDARWTESDSATLDVAADARDATSMSQGCACRTNTPKPLRANSLLLFTLAAILSRRNRR